MRSHIYFILVPIVFIVIGYVGATVFIFHDSSLFWDPIVTHFSNHHQPKTKKTKKTKKRTNYNKSRIRSITDETKLEQIKNYKRNNSIVLNVHIAHHAGTTACKFFKSYGPCPTFACLIDDHWPLRIVPNACRGPSSSVSPEQQHHTTVQVQSIAWNETREVTSVFIQQLLLHYHMISWEFSTQFPIVIPLANTDWEHPQLVSVIIMRHPISRLLAGDGFVLRNFNTPEHRTVDQWWQLASTSYVTNNFALSILAGHDCCNGSSTHPMHLQYAKTLLSRFTFVLDIECLTEGFIALANELGLDTTNIYSQMEHSNQRHIDHTQQTMEEKIHNKTLYQYLLHRNRYDIELYEWSKAISLVDCSAIDT